MLLYKFISVNTTYSQNLNVKILPKHKFHNFIIEYVFFCDGINGVLSLLYHIVFGNRKW